jgi:hypothetical protein
MVIMAEVEEDTLFLVLVEMELKTVPVLWKAMAMASAEAVVVDIVVKLLVEKAEADA